MNSNFWRNKKILITGGNGFLGTKLVKRIKDLGSTVSVPDSSKYDLRKQENCRKVVINADIVIHLAAKVGGIGFNMLYPAEMFYDNLIMGAYMMEEARLAHVKKFVALGTICAYPKYTPVPFKEKDLWIGYPEETNAPYGLAKKMLLVQGQAYRKQYGFKAIYLLPVNLYGPGDKFDPSVSHVIPALIKKITDAKEANKSEVILWGTGNPTREFLYVDDAVDAIIKATEKYDKPDPINIGANYEISILDLAKTICKLLDYKGKIVWDKNKPDGQPRRKLDTSKAKEEFGFVAKTELKEGLIKTLNWYFSSRKKE